ncbi:hypothetical protein KAR91_13940 [Candidatus Pacearchaeota archaeon]|nr:hypothetical protein [Candidatus Pacearchaeota archaeon]
MNNNLRRHYDTAIALLLIIFVMLIGLIFLLLQIGCASAPPIQQTPWLTPTPLTIYELNQTPDTIRHAYLLSGGGVYSDKLSRAAIKNGAGTDQSVPAAQMFLWTYVSRQGVAVYSPMTGGVIPQTPCVIYTRRTR